MHIKRFWLILVALALMIGALPALAQSDQTPDLTDLARYAPADTTIYAALRSDPGYIETLNSVIARLAPALNLPDGINVNFLLDQLASEIDGDFDSLFRPWLGDSVALALAELNEFGDFDVSMIAFSVADREAATRFMDTLLAQAGFEDFTIEETMQGTRYFAPDRPWEGVYLTDDALINYNNPLQDAPFSAPEAALADSDTFSAVIGRLPAPSYNIIAYVDFPALVAANMDFEAMAPEGMALLSGLPDLLTGSEPQAWGATILQGRSLTIDFAQQLNAESAEQLGMRVSSESTVDPAFARFVPADATFVIHSMDLGGTVVESLAQLELIGDTVSASLEDQMFPDRDAEQTAMLDELVAFLRLSYQGLTGTPLAEAAGWVTGDYALYNVFSTDDELLGVDIGAVMAMDPANAEQLAAGLLNALDSWGADYSVSDGVVTIPTVREAVQRALDVPAMASLPNLDLLVGYSDQVFAIGTRPGVEAALAGAGGLDSSPAFMTAAGFLLPQSQSVAYIDMQRLADLLDWAALNAPNREARDAEQAAALVRSFESSTISTRYDEGGLGLVRMVLTLGE